MIKQRRCKLMNKMSDSKKVRNECVTDTLQHACDHRSILFPRTVLLEFYWQPYSSTLRLLRRKKNKFFRMVRNFEKYYARHHGCASCIYRTKTFQPDFTKACWIDYQNEKPARQPCICIYIAVYTSSTLDLIRLVKSGNGFGHFKC